MDMILSYNNYISQLIISFGILIIAFNIFFNYSCFISTIVYISFLIIFGLLFVFHQYKAKKYFIYAFVLSISMKILVITTIFKSNYSFYFPMSTLFIWSIYEILLAIQIIKKTKFDYD